MYKVYGDIYSGNCYKVKLLMILLGIEHEWIPVDILKGESRTERFLTINPNGKIPALCLPDGRRLFESNAILHYLADGTDYLPAERYRHAQVLQWQNFEQYSHEPFIATCRYIDRYLGSPPEMQGEVEARRPNGYAALDVMERHLGANDYFVDDRCTIADISLYAYTHVAGEGGFDLGGYPNINAWIRRMERHPGHMTMQVLAAGTEESS